MRLGSARAPRAIGLALIGIVVVVAVAMGLAAIVLRTEPRNPIASGSAADSGRAVTSAAADTSALRLGVPPDDF